MEKKRKVNCCYKSEFKYRWMVEKEVDDFVYGS